MRGSIYIINSAADATRAGLTQADIVKAATVFVTSPETTSVATDTATTSVTNDAAVSSDTVDSKAKSTAKKLLEKLKIKKADSAIKDTVESIASADGIDPVDRKVRHIDQGTLARLGVKAL